MPTTRGTTRQQTLNDRDNTTQSGSIDSTGSNTNNMSTSTDSTVSIDVINDLKQLMLTMKQEMGDMKQEIMSKLTENQQEIKEIKDEIKSLKSTVTDVEKCTSFNSDKIDEIEQKRIPEIKSQFENNIQHLEEKILLMELHDRKNNLLIYGVEDNNIPNEDTEQVMISSFQRNFAVKDEHIERGIVLVACHRLPRSKFAKPDSPRAVIARFAYASDRQFFGNPKKYEKRM